MSRPRAPRRHTVGGNDLMNEGGRGDNQDEESSKKREAFMTMLAKRYPQYAERIHRPASEGGYPVQNRRPRDPHRRATTVVTYNPGCEQDYDNRSDTMSSVDGSTTFRRGGWMRNSMPAMRSPPNVYDKVSGVVFLVAGNQTKKAELPNEVTHLDTVRALFVRSFPGKLTMEYLASPKQKIYILDTMTNIYYQLEDLQDIKDRTVLRLYESDNEDPQRVREPPPEVRGKQMQASRENTPPRIPEQGRRSQTLPSGMTHSYPPYQEQQGPAQRAKSADRSRSLPRGQGPDYGYITYHAADRMQNSVDNPHYQSTSPADRPNLRPIPEHLHHQNGHHPGYHNGSDVRRSPPTHRSRSADPYYRDLSPPSHAITAPGAPPQTYVAKGVRANTMVSPLRATGPVTQDTRGLNRHTLAFTPMGEPTNQGTMRSQSYRVPPDPSQHVPQRPRSVTPQPTPQDDVTQFRMHKMEEQIASLAAWVQTAVTNTASRASSVRSSHTTTPSEQPSSATSSLSDISGVTQKPVTKNLKDGIMTIKKQASDLKGDLRQIRRMHQLSKESLQESIHETMKKIATALRSVPGADNQLLRQHRVEADQSCQTYLEKKCRAGKELSDLEGAVEELREDVISRQCRVNMCDVEGMALMLSTVTKTFGELKGLSAAIFTPSHHQAGFPDMQKDLKKVMAGEMEVVVNEEKFLKEEPDSIEDALKRCKRLTGTLFTLKRLASVQEHRTPQIPTKQVGGKIPSDDDKRALLDNIKAMVPDHQARLMKLEAADASRQRKKKIITQQEALKFGKSLEIATRLLKPGSKESVSDIVTEEQSSHTTTSVTAKPKTASLIPSPAGGSATTSGMSSPSEFTTTAKKSEGLSSSQKVSEKIDKERVDEDDPRHQAAVLAMKKDVARAAFFSSITTPPTSPSPTEELHSFSPPRPLMDYTVHITQVKDSSTGETQYTVTDGQFSHSSATAQLVTTSSTASSSTGKSCVSMATRSSPTSIPRISSAVKSTETVESSKIMRKIRTSTPIASRESEKATSSKIPSLSLRKDGQIESSSGPDVRPKKIPPPPPPRKSSRLPSPGVKVDTEVSLNGTVSLVASKPELPPKDISILGGHQMLVKDSGIGTSTPKSSVLPKPSSKFEKGIIEAIAVKNKESEGGSESQGDVTAQGAKPKIPSKKPKPPPPQRKSSLSQPEEKSQIPKAKENS